MLNSPRAGHASNSPPTHGHDHDGMSLTATGDMDMLTFSSGLFEIHPFAS